MFLARRVTGHRIRVYPLTGAVRPSAGFFEPRSDSVLVQNGLSGPGTYAIGETPSDAKYALLRVEETLNV